MTKTHLFIEKGAVVLSSKPEVRHHERGKIEKTLFLRHEGGV
jgi:hypothetical protein